MMLWKVVSAQQTEYMKLLFHQVLTLNLHILKVFAHSSDEIKRKVQCWNND